MTNASGTRESCHSHRFGRFELQRAERRLLRDGQPVALGARAFDLLVVLVEHRERLVTKSELLDLVWPGLVVEENNLQVQISALRKLLGPQAIATIPGRGYRFTVALDEEDFEQPQAVLAAPALTTAPAQRTSNLPRELPRLFGRERDLEEVQRLVREHRLVTLTGAGGIGKTQLARAVAHALRADYDAWSIELASVADPRNMVPAVAQVLGVNLSTARPPQQELAEALADQRLLLILDNCEHLLDSVVALAEALLDTAPGVKLLATSQEPLKLREERQYRLGTLALPNANDAGEALQDGAVAMFVERARAVDPHFAVTAESLPAVIDICRQLDGMPLTIELAVARLPLLGVNGLRDRLGERLRLLAAGSRLTLRRHQTLRATLGWSHSLLSADEQAVFRRLGVFAGGWTLEAAQQVAADDHIDGWAVLDHLGALVDKSIVVAKGGDTPRYMLLESMRAYALEQLAQVGETESLVQRHAQVIRALFERAYEERLGEQGMLSEAAYIARVLPEIDNLRAALAWSAGEGGDEALAIALAAASAEAYLVVGLVAEGLAVLRTLMPRVTSAVDIAPATRFWFAVSQVGYDGRVEDDVYVRALERSEEDCRRLHWQRRLYRTLLERAWRHIRDNDVAAGEAALAEAISIERPEWPGWLRSERYNTQSHLITQNGAFEGLQAILDSIATLLPPQGEERRQSQLTVNTAAYCNYRQQWDQAVALLEPLIDRLRPQRRHLDMQGWGYGHLVLALTQLGRLDEAQQRLRQALPLWRVGAILHAFVYVAIRLAVAQGRFADAMRLAGAEDSSAQQFGRRDPLVAGIRAESLRLFEAAVFDPAQRERWRREGELLDEAAIVALCLGEARVAPLLQTSNLSS